MFAALFLAITAPKQTPAPRKEYQEPWYLRVHDNALYLVIPAVVIAGAVVAANLW